MSLFYAALCFITATVPYSYCYVYYLCSHGNKKPLSRSQPCVPPFEKSVIETVPAPRNLQAADTWQGRHGDMEHGTWNISYFFKCFDYIFLP